MTALEGARASPPGAAGMQRIALRASGLAGWRAGLAAGLAGAVSVAGFAPLHAWPVLLATFPMLVWLIDGCCTRAATRARRIAGAGMIGWCFGFGYFFAGLYWIGHAFLVEADRFAWLLPFAVSLMPAGLALFFAAATALAAALWRPGAARVLALALALMVSEWLRGHVLTGFPWIALGYAVTGGEAMMQWASVFGVYALAWFAVAIFAAPATIWGPPAWLARARASRLALPAAMIAALTAATLWGALRLHSAEPGVLEHVRLRIVQPNIPQSEKWKEGNQAQVFDTYLEMSARGPGTASLDGITHLIWPESALPFLLADEPVALEAIAGLLPQGTTFITGALRMEEAANQAGRRLFNSIFVMDDEADMLAVYDKVHLVPFGEYLPFQETLESIGIAQLTGVRGGFTAGSAPRFMHAPGAPAFTPLICYEIVFPGAIRAPGTEPGWVLNVTNDGWFGTSIGPYQHLHQARVRAVEEGLPVVRAANTGVSAVIDPYGRMVAQLPLETSGAIDAQLPQAAPRPPYARWGRIIEFVLLIGALAAWAGATGGGRQSRSA